MAPLTLLLALLAGVPVVVIEHQPPTVGEVATLEARMLSTQGRKVFEPVAFVRLLGTSDYKRIPMEPLPGDQFRASLPSNLRNREVEYFLEVFDEEGNGPFRKGGPDRPLRFLPPSPTGRTDPSPGPAPIVQATRPRPQRTAGVVLIVGGGALLAGGVVSGALALQDFTAEKNATELAAYERAKSAAKTEALVADVLFGVGAVAAAVGALLWLTDGPSSPTVAVGVAPLAGGGAATVSGRF